MLKKRFKIFFLILLISPTFAFTKKSCANIFPPELLTSLTPYNIQILIKPTTDYANIKLGSDCYIAVYPKDTKTVSALVKMAYQYKLPIRIQGNAHSENGSSLPRAQELLIHTDNLNQIKFNKRGEIIAGSGIPIALLDDYLRQHSDYSLPVLNGGGMGPTIGGFISAGGISHTSEKFGGFWNHVYEITIVTGNGNILELTPDDKLFPWLFGSMGQFGIITEARLAVITDRNNPTYPLNKTDHITYQHDDYFKPDHQPLYWFNLFVTENEREQARKTLTEFQSHHPMVLNYIPIYEWTLKNNRFVPPLLFSGNKNFSAMGTWGPKGSSFDKKKLLAMEKEFDALVIKNHYHRYIQAELADKPMAYAQYFGQETYQEFYAIKKKLDPEFLFNSGIVFERVKSQGIMYAIH